MGINRYFTPAQTPQGFVPFQLPFEQMAQTAILAQQQQDATNEGLYNILDTDFPYIQEVDANKQAADRIKQGIETDVNNVRALSENGDLRGLKGEVYNLARKVKKNATSGEIYRLASDYQRLLAWEEANKEQRKLQPGTYAIARQQAIKNLEAAGGSLNSQFSQQDIVDEYNYSEGVDKYTDGIKASVINEANKRSNGFYVETYEQALEYVSEQEVQNIAVGFLSSDPESKRYLQQQVQFGILDPENTAYFKTVKQIDPKTKKEVEVSQLNSLHPAYGAIVAAMDKRAYTNNKTSSSNVLDAAAITLAKWQQEEQNAIVASVGPIISFNGKNKEFEGALDQIDNYLNADDYQSAGTLINTTTEGQPYKIMEGIFDKDAKLTSDVKLMFNKIPKDKNGRKPSWEQFKQAFIIAAGGTNENDFIQIASEVLPFAGTAANIKLQRLIEAQGFDYFEGWITPGLTSSFKGLKNTADLHIMQFNNKIQSAKASGEIGRQAAQPMVFNLSTDKTWNALQKPVIANNGANLLLYENLNGTAAGTSLQSYLNKLAEAEEGGTATLVGFEPATSVDSKDLLQANIIVKNGKTKTQTQHSLYVTPNSNLSNTGAVYNLTSYGQNKLRNNPAFAQIQAVSDTVKFMAPYIPSTYSKREGAITPIKLPPIPGKNYQPLVNFVTTLDNNGIVYYVPDLPGVSQAEREKYAFQPSNRDEAAVQLAALYSYLKAKP